MTRRALTDGDVVRYEMKTRRISSYAAIKHRVPRAVDYYQMRGGRQVWILHEDGCQRQMCCGGLCSCEDPETFEI